MRKTYQRRSILSSASIALGRKSFAEPIPRRAMSSTTQFVGSCGCGGGNAAPCGAIEAVRNPGQRIRAGRRPEELPAQHPYPQLRCSMAAAVASLTELAAEEGNTTACCSDQSQTMTGPPRDRCPKSSLPLDGKSRRVRFSPHFRHAVLVAHQCFFLARQAL